MSTIEDFEKAPAGATATRADGGRVMKMLDDGEQRWITRGGFHLDNKQIADWDYALDPPYLLPTRDEIAEAIADGWNSVTTLNATAQSIGPSAAADAVLALLKGQEV